MYRSLVTGPLVTQASKIKFSHLQESLDEEYRASLGFGWLFFVNLNTSSQQYTPHWDDPFLPTVFLAEIREWLKK